MLVFRNDDINPSTNQGNLSKTYSIIKSVFPDSKILSCITLFSKYNNVGAVYREVPFKSKPVNWFYDVDKFLLEYEYMTKDHVASHGLFHVDHAKIGKDAQEMSILGSCSFLKTNLFCAPFNSFNQDTRDICEKNEIRLINDVYPWRSLEHQPFDPNHKYWYFHSWRVHPDTLKRKLCNDAKLGN